MAVFQVTADYSQVCMMLFFLFWFVFWFVFCFFAFCSLIFFCGPELPQFQLLGNQKHDTEWNIRPEAYCKMDNSLYHKVSHAHNQSFSVCYILVALAVEKIAIIVSITWFLFTCLSAEWCRATLLSKNSLLCQSTLHVGAV